MKIILILLLLFPLAGAVINALAAGRLPRRWSGMVACLAVLGATAMAAAGFVFLGVGSQYVPLAGWIKVTGFTAPLSLLYNPLSAIMALMVTFVSSIIHLYSVAFMRDDEDYARYFCYLNLFVFAMLVITLADNLLFFYLGWEGVGFCSYALIGFWYRDEKNAEAGRKAFVTTRIGDVGFGIALALLVTRFGSLSLSYLYGEAGGGQHGPGHGPGPAAPVGGHGQIGATAPDGVAAGRHGRPHPGVGPDSRRHHGHRRRLPPHAACSPLSSHSPLALTVIAGVGAVTTMYAALAALGQWDIKKMLAYSTISQVGYMILAVGAARHHRRHVPPVVPRLLQIPAVFDRGLRHPGRGRRA